MKYGKMNIFEAENLYFLGPEGTYAQQAMKHFVKDLNIKAKNILPKNSITAVINAVDKEKNSMAVLPIENSIEGIVRETIDNLVKANDKNLKITAETIIPINHCLMSNGKSLKDIKYIISHPQALGQCAGFIGENLPDINTIKAASTSEAARIVSEKNEEYAAIGSEIAAEIFNLNILAKNINDVKDNKTRFILLAKLNREATGNDKTSIFFSVKNEPGSLCSILNVFKDFGINLIYIESRPSKKKMGEYNFCIDLEGHITDKKISDAVAAMKQHANVVSVTGSYPQFQSHFE